MFDFPIEKYKFYVTKNKVIAVSTYKGKIVRGVAICSDSDTFDLEKGKQLAAARCNYKVAQKRRANAEERYNFFAENFSKANNDFLVACNYFTDSSNKLKEVENALHDLEASL